MAAIVNETAGELSKILLYMDANVTGSIFFSLLLIYVLLYLACLGFKLPKEIAVAIVFPFLLTAIFLEGGFLAVIMLSLFIIAERVASYLAGWY